MEAALGRGSALTNCKHRSKDIKMLVLIWQGQHWDNDRQRFAGKEGNDNISISIIIGLCLRVENPRAVRKALICFFSSRRANGI